MHFAAIECSIFYEKWVQGEKLSGYIHFYLKLSETLYVPERVTRSRSSSPTLTKWARRSV